MWIEVLWWIGHLAAIGVILGAVNYAIERVPIAEPFKSAAKVGVLILAVIVLIVMVFRLFTILGHPLA